MSAADVEVVRGMYEAFNRGEYDRATSLLHEDVELQLEEEWFNVWEVRQGRPFRCRIFSRENEAREAAGLPAR